MARTRQQQGQAAKQIDLKRSSLPERPDPQARLLSLYERFVKTHPEQAAALLERCRELTERFRSPRTTPDLNAIQAARRIGESERRVHELFEEGRLGARVSGVRRFSEKECDQYRNSERKAGRPRKSE